MTLRWNNGKGQAFELMIAVDADYLFTVRQTVANSGPGAVALTVNAAAVPTSLRREIPLF